MRELFEKMIDESMAAQKEPTLTQLRKKEGLILK